MRFSACVIISLLCTFLTGYTSRRFFDTWTRNIVISKKCLYAVIALGFCLYATGFIPLCASDEDPDVALLVGVNTHYEQGEALDRIPEMRIRIVRTGVTWADIEPTFETPPRYEWGTADAIVAEHKSRGTTILWGFFGTPEWASEKGGLNGVPKDAVARERFREFVRAVVERYKDDIQYFEVWNEPNLERFWIGSVDEYIDYWLIPVHEEVKRVDQNKKVIGPGLALLNSSARIQVDDFFKVLGWREAHRYLDAISQHAYEGKPSGIVEQFERGDYQCLWFFCWKKRDSLYEIYERTGFGNHPIWLTEFGWRTDKVSETRQAEYIVETLQLLAYRPRFYAAIIYELKDGPSPQYEEKYGLLRDDSTPKAVAAALRERKLIPSAPSIGRECDPQEPKECGFDFILWPK